MPDFSLSEQDLVDKLEEIAADDRNRSAQLAAIKQLQVIRGDVVDRPSASVSALYEVAQRRVVSPRLRSKAG